MNLSQNSWIHHRNHHPAPALHHLLTSFSQRKSRSEFTHKTRILTPPPKKKKRPTKHFWGLNFMPAVLGRCDPAHCNLYDTPIPLRRRPTLQGASRKLRCNPVTCPLVVMISTHMDSWIDSEKRYYFEG